MIKQFGFPKQDGKLFSRSKDVEIEIDISTNETWDYVGYINYKHVYKLGNVTIRLSDSLDNSMMAD